MFSGIPARITADIGTTGGIALDTTLQEAVVDLDKFTFIASRLLVDGSEVTQPISATSLPLPTGAATAANQGTEISSLASIDGKMNSLGQKTMAASMPITIAVDQPPIMADISFGVDSVGNSSIATLAAGISFVGAWEDVSGFAVIAFSIFSDQASAAGGLTTQWSSDGSNVDVTDSSNLLAGVGRAFSLSIRSRFFRIVYTNGAVSQGSFRLGTVYHKSGTGLISRPLSQTLTDDNYAQTVRSVINAKLPSGSYRAASMGQTVMANAMSMVIASDQTPIPVILSGDVVTVSENIAQWGGVATSLGQKVMASSVPITIASDQASIPVASTQVGTWNVGLSAGTNVIGHVIVDSGLIAATQSGTWNVGLSAGSNIVGSAKIVDSGGVNVMAVGASGNLLVSGLAAVGSLPSLNPISVSGVDTSGNKQHFKLSTTGHSLVDLNDGSGTSITVGQKVMASSLPVTIASDQTAVPISGTITSNQGTANATPWNQNVSQWGGSATSLGQKAMASSLPIVPASDYIPPTAADLSASGSIGALNATLVLAIHGSSSTLASIGGTWVGTIQIQGQAPDGSWANLSTKPIPAAGNAYSSNAIASNGNYRVLTTASYQAVRALMATYTSGSATINIISSVGISTVEPVQSIASNLNAQVVGSVADGAAVSANSVVVGGKDQSGNARTLTITPSSDGDNAAQVITDPTENPTYMASTNGTVTTGTAAANVTSIGYLFHAAAETKRYEIVRIRAKIITGSANAGDLTLRLARITAENGTPGGTSQTINPLDPADAALNASSVFRTGATGAPTRQTGDLASEAHDANTTGQGGGTSNNSTITVFDEHIYGKPLVCRNGQAEGWEVRAVVGAVLTAGVKVSLSCTWRAV